jgi:FlaA1/EpsC-like NDP-sugar epimerase
MKYFNWVSKLIKFTKWIITENSFLKFFIILLIDLIIFLFSFFLIFSDHINKQNYLESLLFFSELIIISYVVYFFSGQYKSLVRYVGSKSFYPLAIRNLLITISLSIFINFFHEKVDFDKRDFIFLWVNLTAFIIASRVVLRDTLIQTLGLKRKSKNVAIYGAGAAGAQLYASLRLTGTYDVKLFVDDDENLWRRTLNGIPINNPYHLNEIKNRIDLILLAIPSLSNQRRLKIISALDKIGLPVLQIPNLDELTEGRKINSFKPIPLVDLLGRQSNESKFYGMKPFFKDSVCFVSGAGGSIGSELCRTLVSFKPSKIIIFERSEPSLFAIEQEIIPKIDPETSLISILGCAQNEELLLNIFNSHEVDFVFHAAAYKHVPLVEANPLQGILNNVFSTESICKAATNTGVKKVTLISSDKAVRPTNVMGASKRLSELLVQAYSELENKKKYPKTIFSIVRFGNVLGSSGSVVPTFVKQISSGGPVTITHPDIIRYFMTINEASKLVIQAMIYATGGEVFLLDMGKPLKIIDLAKKMILLSGLTVRDKNNPNGDIEIIFTGLRPGEKLYEELLIGSESSSTKHPLIFKAKEKGINANDLLPKLVILKKVISSLDRNLSMKLLSELVPEWRENK